MIISSCDKSRYKELQNFQSGESKDPERNPENSDLMLSSYRTREKESGFVNAYALQTRSNDCLFLCPEQCGGQIFGVIENHAVMLEDRLPECKVEQYSFIPLLIGIQMACLFLL
ncbi:hypothetical protein PALA111701_04390 [Paenibacillus lactis]